VGKAAVGEVDVDVLNADIARAALTLLKAQGRTDHRWRKLIALSEDREAEGLRRRPPCRFQEVQVLVSPLHRKGLSGHVLAVESSKNSPVLVDVILDVAHNEDSIRALAHKLRVYYPGRSKRWELCIV